MRNSYIANSAEALNLHNGSQTAIVVAMKVQPNKAMWNTVKTHPKTDWCDEHGKPLFPPYALGQEVYVRESWGEYPNAIYTVYFADYPKDATKYFYPNGNFEPVLCDLPKKRSAATMPKSAARTRFKIVSCEAVRVKDIYDDDAETILDYKSVDTGGDDYFVYFRNYLGSQKAEDFPYFEETNNGIKKSWQSYIITRFGQSAWDNNDYIWFYKIEKI
jgi:hypothetical protein